MIAAVIAGVVLVVLLLALWRDEKRNPFSQYSRPGSKYKR